MKIQRSMLTTSVLVALFAVTVPVSGMAQGEIGRVYVISTNPLLDMFSWFNGEFEIKIAPATTIGVSGTYYTFKQEETVFTGTSSTTVEVDDKYSSFYGFFRYYMQGEALKGFYFSARGGFNQVKANIWSDEILGQEVWVEETGSFFGFGIDVGYGWLLGDEERFSVSLGVGAIRLFGGDLEDADILKTLPTIRLINVGVAF